MRPVRQRPNGDLVKLRRLAAGLTQVEAADLIHKSVDTFRGYERGRVVMQLDTWELFLLKTRKHVRRQGSR
jgi:transcriptional regulator with XRE-family HTH domain